MEASRRPPPGHDEEAPMDTDPRPGEEDVDRDDAQALSRATGGDEDAPEVAGTTGTGAAGTFVGRVAGDDDFGAGETGAERRAAAEKDG
jgi:hypothetical protein